MALEGMRKIVLNHIVLIDIILCVHILHFLIFVAVIVIINQIQNLDVFLFFLFLTFTCVEKLVLQLNRSIVSTVHLKHTRGCEITCVCRA